MPDFSIVPTDSFSIGDLVNSLGGLADSTYSIFKPLQGQAGDIFSSVLSGGPQSTDLIKRLAAPGVSSINAHLPQTIRQITDTLGPGGAAAKGISSAYSNAGSDMSKLFGSLQNSLIGSAIDTGVNLPSQIAPLLTSAGGLRVGEKQAGASGGKK